MSARKISTGQFKQLRRLMRIAQSDIAAVYRTKLLIADLLPQERGLGIDVDECVDRGLSARELLRRRNLVVKGKR
jgi:hypothetical protein